MKNFYFLPMFLALFVNVSAQSFFENKSVVDQEIARYHKMVDFNINPNTLNYDIKYQRLDLQLDPNILWVAGSVTSHFLAKENLSNIYFDFTNTIPVSQVTYHGQILNFQQISTKELKIDFPTTIATNSLDSLTIHYSGVPDNSGRTSFYVGSKYGNPTLATLSEPYGAQNWFPTKQSMNDKIDRFDFKITTPDQFDVAANGKLMSETPLPNNQKMTFWRTQYPMAAYLAAVSIGKFTKMNDVMGASNFPFVNYIYNETATSSAILANLEWTKTAMNIFENHFGPYPFSNEKYGHMEFNVNGAAMEHQTMSSMGDFGKGTIAHELAHQWFGDKITCGSWNDIWLNEGFATFGEHLIFEKNLMSQPEFMNYLQAQLNDITSLPNGSIYVSDSNLGNVPVVFSGRLSYRKGGYVLRMMKWILGDDVFYQLLRDYTANPSFVYGYAKTEDFKNQILVSTGKDFTGFFNDWIYGQGYPTYTIKWNQIPGNPNVAFSVSQIQSDSSVDFFELPLPVKVVGTNGEIANLVLDHSYNNQQFSQPVNFQVASVTFNDERQIIEKNSAVVFDPSLSVISSENQRIALYPNPVQNEIFFNGIQKVSKYEIFSLDGKLVITGNYHPPKGIAVNILSKGTYLIKINGRSFKFIKE
ncbi:T9SS type A sorting domain-containing protein [Chryseobacterium suipulveris]|uniref:Aminopeptidase N n=1 Tax=Chryseobacterium suipulveris TaxID=2929800 RepID=A0ABY4BUF2_9FLAO|nr:M1 family aminopeptidase [Chryseobacterium suipulveris]UOE41822.1 T9SS type A sorting domain-containing protein [Chryseobacterium suipulveris]